MDVSLDQQGTCLIAYDGQEIVVALERTRQTSNSAMEKERKSSFLEKNFPCYIEEDIMQQGKTKKKNRIYWTLLLLSMLVPAVYAWMVSTRTMPYAEGWYTYYSQCMAQGAVPYKDFEYLFPPVYIYLIYAFTQIFGYKIIALRLFGVVLFAVIALGVFLTVCTITGKRKAWIAFVSSCTAVFYFQSEAVQVFYDYVRVMDLFSIFATLFLIRAVKNIRQNQSAKVNLILCGICSALVGCLKQNVGALYIAYTLVLLVFVGLYCRQNLKQIARHLVAYVLPIAVGLLLVVGFLAVNGALTSFLSMTTTDALDAKGGLLAVMFNWIPNNFDQFVRLFPQACLILLGLILLFAWDRYQEKTNENSAVWQAVNPLYAFVFAAAILVLLFAFSVSESVADFFSPNAAFSPYLLFLVGFTAFVAMGIWFLVQIIRKKQDADSYLLLFALSGVYVTISYGCGNSGGLAEGQATTGIAFLTAAALLWASHHYHAALRIAITCGCALLVLQSAAKKMVTTYNWWGMTEFNYWDSQEETDLPLLDGILVSEETKSVYEGIVHTVQENTSETDTIFCFPQIPIFYTLCDRMDPGTESKVQWFDVSSDRAVLSDMDVIREAQPAAIIIYDTQLSTYEAHQRLFRGNQTSSTYQMREFLFNYVYENGYTWCGNFTADANTIQLWIKNPKQDADPVFAGGSGTLEDPYLIETPQQLITFGNMVNEGRSFEKQYIRQENDLDMTDHTLAPIGKADAPFEGTYDGGGHVIRNLTIEGKDTDDIGLFSVMNGSVYNLGLEGGSLSGGNCGAIVASSSNSRGKIVNCYTDISVQGMRAGGLADNFAGSVWNSFCAGRLSGIESAGAISYNNTKDICKVFYSEENSKSVFYTQSMADERITSCSPEILNSTILLGEMNDYVNEFNKQIKSISQDEDSESTLLPLVHWKLGGDGHLVFDCTAS